MTPSEFKFVDMVRVTTTTIGVDPFHCGPAVPGFQAFGSCCQPGDTFYYSAQGIDRPDDREVGVGTYLADGRIGRDPIAGQFTRFGPGTKTIALVAEAEWMRGAPRPFFPRGYRPI